VHSRTQQGTTNREHEFFVVERFREIVAGSEAQRLEYAIVIHLRRKHDHTQPGSLGAQPAQ
jgi:hypothetical protein